ncbi:MAG: outer membrane protein [Candidatus Acidiferrales bacterium]
MRRIVVLGGLLLLWIAPAVAQDGPAATQDQSVSAPVPQAPVMKVPPETPKYEISGGYTVRSNYQTDTTKPYFNGFYGSFDRNIFHWLGAEAEFTRTAKNQGVITGDSRVYTFLVGPTFYPFGHRKVTLFGHALYGLGVESTTTGPFAGFGVNTTAKGVRAWEAGGGLDWNRWQHWSIRLIEADFGGANFTGAQAGGGSLRFSAGVVYRFGHK